MEQFRLIHLLILILWRISNYLILDSLYLAVTVVLQNGALRM